jgi:hypothetical protein
MNYIKTLLILSIVLTACEYTENKTNVKIKEEVNETENSKIEADYNTIEDHNIKSYSEFESIEGTYVPEKESNNFSKFKLIYNPAEGNSRPSCQIIFNNGFEIVTLPVCEGDFFWCLRDNENKEFGSMKLQFTKDGKFALLETKEGQYSNLYGKYLENLNGKLKRITSVR